MQNWITGVDIGGTHITVGLIDTASGNLHKESLTRHHLNPKADEGEIINVWASAILDCWEKQHLTSLKIGIAMPGPFDYENGVSLIKGLCKYEALYERPVKTLLGEALNINPSQIRMVNDATAYMIGECSMGSGKDANNVLGITLGTGLGSALYRKGNYEEGDLYCFPFRESQAEEYFSTRWFLSRYEHKTGKKLNGVKELADLCEKDPVALECFTEFAQNMAALFRERYAPEIPDNIIIGGNIANASALFFPVLEKELGPGFKIKKACLGETAALIGAAYLWKN